MSVCGRVACAVNAGEPVGARNSWERRLWAARASAIAVGLRMPSFRDNDCGRLSLAEILTIFFSLVAQREEKAKKTPIGRKDHAYSCTAAPVAHLHHVSFLRPAAIPQPIPHVEGHYARAEMNLENPSTSYDAE